MALLRLFLVFCLSLSVPTVALASLVNAEHCHRGKVAATTTSGHSQHALHAGMESMGDHSQQLAHPKQSANGDTTLCDCGCTCSTVQCATSGAALIAFGTSRDFFNLHQEQRLIHSGSASPLAGYPLDLFRPPSLI
jgi:hypothetical protein